MATKKKAVKKKAAAKAKKTAAKKTAVKKKTTPAQDVPSMFRINVEVGDIDKAAEFYGRLLGLVGRKAPGSRCYFSCGPVTLQVVAVPQPHPAAKALYFTVNNLDAIFERARTLGCLSRKEVHGVSGGAITVRPWGERSFYAEDEWDNPLCFVQAGTVYGG